MTGTLAGLVASLALLTSAACGSGRPPASHDGGDPAPSSDPAPAAAGKTGGASSAGLDLRDPVPLAASVAVGGSSATFSGMGECHHTTDAAIYEVPAAMWTAALEAKTGELSYLSLTLWQPKSGGDMQISLGVTLGRATHQIATVKGAPIRGSGTATVEPRAQGGSLNVQGATADGRSVRVTVDCSAFTEPVAEGG